MQKVIALGLVAGLLIASVPVHAGPILESALRRANKADPSSVVGQSAQTSCATAATDASTDGRQRQGSVGWFVGGLFLPVIMPIVAHGQHVSTSARRCRPRTRFCSTAATRRAATLRRTATPRPGSARRARGSEARPRSACSCWRLHLQAILGTEPGYAHVWTCLDRNGTRTARRCARSGRHEDGNDSRRRREPEDLFVHDCCGNGRNRDVAEHHIELGRARLGNGRNRGVPGGRHN